ncbi:MBL fold metallo-hydrolase [Nonomuraea sp. NPDC049607]|uniref:MBL fold metallo-hydrolase n=1 Tax=Nonomuraea sp. NPDC049607 TaxID=3154732 RepID=UPI003444C127
MLDHEGEAMRLTVLGCRAGMPSHGVASSGYLVTTAGTRLLLDCGPGTATALSGVTRPDDLSGIVISHLHIDHCYDLLPLGRRIPSGQLTAHDTDVRPLAIPLHVPAGGRDLLHSLAGLFSPSAAGAAQLMLTHLPHRDAIWYETLKAEAELHFDGPVHLATPGLEFDLA